MAEPTLPQAPDPLRASAASRRWLYGPFIILAIFCAIWTAFWFFARSKAEAVLDAALAREAAAGRVWTCPDRSITGFPFRMSLDCVDPSFASGSINGRFARLQIDARALDPTAVLLRFTGPLTLTDGVRAADVEWTSARMSLRASGLALGTADLRADGVKARLRQPAMADIAVAADLVETHLRQRDGSVADGRADYDLAALLDKLTSPALDGVLGDAAPARVELQGTVTRLPLQPMGALGPLVDGWREAGGTVRLVLADLRRGEASLSAKGTLTPTPPRMLDGTLDLSFKALDRIATALDLPGAGMVAPLLKSGAMPLVLADGAIRLGPLPIARQRPIE